MAVHRFDIIGDVHGELPALMELLGELGYTGNSGQTLAHPEGRHLIFLGDLVDRGAHSLDVCKLVASLVERGQATCVMGNHEYNLVACLRGINGYEKPKQSNAATVAEVHRDLDAWRPTIDFLAELPLAIDLPDLRIIHACWHGESLGAVRPVLRPGATFDLSDDAATWARGHVSLTTPFCSEGLKHGLENKSGKDHDPAHEIPMKGFEVLAPEPFKDNDGAVRKQIRATWWVGSNDVEVDDRTCVFGHYWNMPPLHGHFVPPHPSGHPDLRRWQRGALPDVISNQVGSVTAVDAKHVCVDFQGVTQVSDALACIGAFRWPERDVVWACGPKTRQA